MPKVLLLAWDKVFEIKDALGTTKNKPEDLQELFRELSNDVQKIHEELAEYINTLGWNRPAFYDDDDDDDGMSIFSATESDEFIKSSVENLVPNPSEPEGENGCDVPSCFTTFSNILFDDEYEFDSVDDQSLHNEDFSEKIFSNPLFEEEIISIKKNQHHFNAKFDLVESMLNHDSSIISSPSKIDSLLDKFVDELTLLKSIPPGIDKTDCHPENEIRLSQRLLYDNSSPRPPEEFNPENSNAEIESFSNPKKFGPKFGLRLLVHCISSCWSFWSETKAFLN
nr:hypothetical protein [Tanacetum cinerariifolium]